MKLPVLNKKIYQKGMNFIYSKPGLIIGVILDFLMIVLGLFLLITFIKRKEAFLIADSIFILGLGIFGIIQSIYRINKVRTGKWPPKDWAEE